MSVNKVTVRTALERRNGRRVFYVSSFTRDGDEYPVLYTRRPGLRRWACACYDFFFRRADKHRHCKHIKLVRGWVQLAGGLRMVGCGLKVTVPTKPTALPFDDEDQKT